MDQELEQKETRKEEAETILRDGRNCYLRTLLESGGEQGYEIQMINRTQPPHFLRMSIMEQSHDVFLDYNITGLVSVTSVEKNELLTYLYAIITSLPRVGEECEEYLIPAEKVDLTPSHIFLRMETGQVYYAFSPEKSETMQESLQKLLEYFMKNSNLMREEDVLNVYGMYQRTLEANVTFKSLYDFLQENRIRESSGVGIYQGGSQNRAKESKELGLGYGQEKSAMEKSAGNYAMDKQMCDRLGIEFPEETTFDVWRKEQEISAEGIQWQKEENFAPQATNPIHWDAQPKEKAGLYQQTSEKTGIFAKLKKVLSGKSMEIGIGVLAFAISAWLLLT